MAAHLNRLRHLQCICLLVALGASQLAQGVELFSDPTRPSAAATAGSSMAALPAKASGPHLQSILVSPKRRLAVIDGVTVQIGDTVGDARVIRIQEMEVVLKAGNEVRVLRMYPDIEKKMAAAEAESRTNKRK